MSQHATHLSQRKRKLTILLPDDVVGILIVVKNPRSTLEIMERRGIVADLDKSRYPTRRLTLTGPQAGIFGAVKVLLQALQDLERHTISTDMEVELNSENSTRISPESMTINHRKTRVLINMEKITADQLTDLSAAE